LATVTKKLYEGMFLLDTAAAAADWDGVIGSIESILKRVEAEVISLRKWDERRLAYDISKVSRGTYILAYFKCDGEKIQEIEKTVQLSEKIMRVLILNAEHMTHDDIERDTPSTKAEKAQEERQAAVEAKIAEAKAAAETKVAAETTAAEPVAPADVSAVAPADAAEPGEDAEAAVETKSADEPVSPVEKKEDAVVESAPAPAAGEESPDEAGTEVVEDESKAAE